MKMKLITIGILALLLCAMVPMAASAAHATPKEKPVIKDAPVWYYGFWGVRGDVLGTITFNTNNGKYTVTCHGLDPTKTYEIAIHYGPEPNYGTIQTIYPVLPSGAHARPDSSGAFTIKAQYNNFPDWPGEIGTIFYAGGFFVVTPDLP